MSVLSGNGDNVGRVKKGGCSQALPMRKTDVPQLGQTPLIAGFPFLSVTGWGFFISTFILHFTQYACGICFSSERTQRN